MTSKSCKIKCAIFFIFFVFAFLYLIYAVMQCTNVFFEAQFLHMPFLKGLVAHHLTGKDIFTTYGEHLFPGYNLILAVNYYLFHIWGGFDNIITALFLAAAAAVVVWRFSVDDELSNRERLILCTLTSLLLLSTTNTAQWGMAVSAVVGVSVFALCAALSTDVIWERAWNKSTLAFLMIPLSCIVFLGAYAVGCIAALLAIVVLDVIKKRSLSVQAALIVMVSVATTFLYVFLVRHYGGSLQESIFVSFNTHILKQIIQFGLLITGSSLLGKAFFEHSSLLYPYYIVGFMLVVLTIYGWWIVLRNPTRGRMFAFALSVYSVSNIIVVSFCRYQNGAGGALGEWYSAHTHFIAVTVLYFILSNLEKKTVFKRLFVYMICSIICFFAVIGYVYDWRKGLYVGAWKQQFVAEAPTILAFPNQIKNRSDVWQTMLWNYNVVKPSIDFLYKHHLWIFHRKAVLVTGLDQDGWLESDHVASIICPYGTKEISFSFFRKEGWPKSVVMIHKANGASFSKVVSGSVNIPINKKYIPAIEIDPRNEQQSRPVVASPDVRKLVCIISKVSCLPNTN